MQVVGVLLALTYTMAMLLQSVMVRLELKELLTIEAADVLTLMGKNLFIFKQVLAAVEKLNLLLVRYLKPSTLEFL